MSVFTAIKAGKLNFIRTLDLTTLKESKRHFDSIIVEDFPAKKNKPIFNPKIKRDIVLPIHAAAIYNQLEIFIYLVKAGIDINSPSESSISPLSYACFLGSFEVVCYILAVDKTIKKESDYLYYASFCDDYRIVQLLIDNGFVIQHDNSYFDPIKNALQNGYTKTLTTLFKHIEKSQNTQYIINSLVQGNWDFLRSIMQDDDIKKMMMQSDKNFLMYACQNANTPLDIFNTICSITGDLDSKKSEGRLGLSAIHYICQTENIEMLKIALKYTIDVNRLTTDGRSGPMFFTSNDEEKEIEILELLVKHGFDINRRKYNKITLLEHFALGIKRKYKIIKWLIEHNASLTAPYSAHQNLDAITIGEKILSLNILKRKMEEMNLIHFFENVSPDT